jgi:acetyl-CoA carboxylase carboxyltransferase component
LGAFPVAVAADLGFVGAIIQPRETLKKLIQALAMLETKRDKILRRSMGIFRCRSASL